MNYKTAYVIRYLCPIVGIMIAAISVILYDSAFNFVFVLGVIVAIVGFLVDAIFCRCPECGHKLPWITIGMMKHCPHCRHEIIL